MPDLKSLLFNEMLDIKGLLTLSLRTQLLDAQSFLPTDSVSPLPARPSSPILLPLDSPRKPVFSLDLDELFKIDGLVVPIIVSQCIVAVDLFGIDSEGIYRHSGTQSDVDKMRDMFDTGMSRFRT